MIASVVISICLFIALLVVLGVGHRIGKRLKYSKDDIGTGAAEGVIYAIFGLMIAFTFSSSASRFNDRRKLIVDQANALGTASLRLDALEVSDRIAIRQKVLQWVEIAQHFSDGDTAARSEAVARASDVQGEVWRLAASAVEKKQLPQLWSFVMAPINDWTDLSSTRLAQVNLGPPPMVIPTLIAMSLVTSLLVGFQMSLYQRRSVLHRVAFAGILSFLILVIFDFNHPRSGIIQVGSVDESMAQVEQSLKAALDGK